MAKRKISRSLKKYIRNQKALIKKDTNSEEERKKKIKALYVKLNLK